MFKKKLKNTYFKILFTILNIEILGVVVFKNLFFVNQRAEKKFVIIKNIYIK